MQKSRAALTMAANVRALMKRDGMSQEELGRLSGVSKSAIGYLLNYKDSSSRHAGIDTIEGIARVFKLSPGALVDESFTDVRARELQEVRPSSQLGMTALPSVEGLAKAIGMLEAAVERTGFVEMTPRLQAEMLLITSNALREGKTVAAVGRMVVEKLRAIGAGPKDPEGTAGGRGRGKSRSTA